MSSEVREVEVPHRKTRGTIDVEHAGARRESPPANTRWNAIFTPERVRDNSWQPHSSWAQLAGLVNIREGDG